MNQQCKVCGEPAAGFHFGAFTCEGCKSFFGRTYNNLSSISECKNNGECVINKKNRTACKGCRLRKCIMVGMSKSGSRYGRRSNWFKIHCLLQEQQQKNSANSTSGGCPRNVMSSNYLPAHFLSNICNNKNQESQRSFSSPSDSGASSADLEESEKDSVKDRVTENSSIESKTEKSLIRSIKTESFLSKDEQMTSCYSSRCLSEAYLQITPITLPSTNQPINIITSTFEEQDEPIDLSVKSCQKNSLSLTLPTTILDTTSSKPVPLDLSLVRGKSLLG